MEDHRRARIANCRRAAQRRKRQAPRSDGDDAARAAHDGRERLVAPGGQAGHFQAKQDDERLGQRAKAQRQKGRIGRTVLELRAFAEPVGPGFVNDEIARDGLGQPQDGEQDEAQGEWQTGSALGEAGERDEPGDDPPQRLDIPSCVTHARPPLISDIFARVFRVGMEWGRKSWKSLILLGVGVEPVHELGMPTWLVGKGRENRTSLIAAFSSRPHQFQPVASKLNALRQRWPG